MKTTFARLCVLSLCVPGLAVAADKESVVAEINGAKLHTSDIVAYQRSLPPQMAAQAPYPVLLDMAVNNYLVAEQARKDGLEKDPQVRQALKELESQLLVKAWMNRKLKAAITDGAVKQAYDRYLAEFKPEEEVRARHILTEGEDAAKAVLADLKKGADFTETAKTKSKDPSAKANGGDLGFFTKDEMVKEFADAAFAMKPGELSAAPVKSQFGWHVIKVDERRMASAPSLEQAAPAIREQLAEETAQKMVADMRGKAKVKLFTPDGQPLEANPPAKK
ncbi:PpiC-type peptidyl-prolyl cis-trans isomerase [Magnetospirillum sp. LM-5]|uniref:peptidylprolyl isomerase n=1 Tax=Magnetospirillum sp. LM-5 TaxID=2681466 RepID=UPI001383BFCF|nr:peptidylprolyl isomerase [Magnetospirillum sp. LM-5]CAA7624782.1 PpiC-type peptidyl-prolyl cis-trans isomerase [Magnetospirillum sp. LM-5]